MKPTPEEIIIQANFAVGRGFSIIIKLKLLDEIKNHLVENLKSRNEDKKYEVKTQIKNLQDEIVKEKEINRKFVLDDKKCCETVDHDEFNILLIQDVKSLKKPETPGSEKVYQLIATTDPANKSKYNEYLQSGTGNKKEKDECYDTIVKKILKYIKN